MNIHTFFMWLHLFIVQNPDMQDRVVFEDIQNPYSIFVSILIMQTDSLCDSYGLSYNTFAITLPIGGCVSIVSLNCRHRWNNWTNTYVNLTGIANNEKKLNRFNETIWSFYFCAFFFWSMVPIVSHFFSAATGNTEAKNITRKCCVIWYGNFFCCYCSFDIKFFEVSNSLVSRFKINDKQKTLR